MRHYFEVDRYPSSATCIHCGIVARVELLGMGHLRIKTRVYALDENGTKVSPGRIPCTLAAARGGGR